MEKKATGVSPIWLEPAAICRARASSSDFTFCGSSFTFFFLLCPPSWPPSPGFSSASSSSSCASGSGPLFQTGYVDASGAAGPNQIFLDEWGALFLCVIFQKGGKELPALFCRHFRLPPTVVEHFLLFSSSSCSVCRGAEHGDLSATVLQPKTSRLEHWNFVVVGPSGRMNTVGSVNAAKTRAGYLTFFEWKIRPTVNAFRNLFDCPLAHHKSPKQVFCVLAARLQRQILSKPLSRILNWNADLSVGGCDLSKDP